MNSFKYLLIFFALLTGLCPSLKAQKSIQDSAISLTMLSINYGGYNASGDMANRFGFTNLMGGEVGYKFKNNFYVNGGMQFLWGRTVKEWVGQNVTSAVFDSTGAYQIMAIGADGRWYEIRYFERGFVIPVTVGKQFPVFKKHNKNSGFYLEVGAQFIQHKIKIEPRGNNVPALDPPFRPGYDRLTNGIGIKEGFGYRYFSNNRKINFFVGLDLSQNFTQGRRSIQYDTGLPDNAKRRDLLFGFKAGWIFPVYKQAGEDYYLY